METREEEKSVYELFRISVILKGLISLVEVVSGVLIFFIPPMFIISVANWMTQGELRGEPGDFVARHLLILAQQFSASAGFVAVYLLTRGLIKVFLIWALLKNKLWAYPLSLVVLGLFVIYQLYQIITTHSLIVVGITLFDLVVIYFVWREYQIVRKHEG